MSQIGRTGGKLPRPSRARQRGLTLLELIVVLAILAALGTVMLTQTTSLTNEARYEQTVRTLEQLQDAVIGRTVAADEDPTSVPPGFVADVGRLPLAGTDQDISELWDINGGTGTAPTAFALQTLTGLDDDLQIACGWRGPYVRRPVGSDDLRDGWGRAFALDHSDGTDVDAATDEVAELTSSGSDIFDSFDQDLVVVLADSSVPIDRTTGQVTLNLNFEYGASGDRWAVVRLYGPVNGTAQVVAQDLVENTTGSAGTPETLSVTFSPADIPIGPKLLRAYQWNSAIAPATTDDLTSITARESLARRVTVLAGGATWDDLELVGN